MSSLRRAEKEDGPVVLALVGRVLAGYGLCTNPGEIDKDLSDLDLYYFDNGGWFGVIEDEGRIIGSYGILRLDEQSCELRKMYLLDKYQGQGLGKMMLEDALHRAKKLGYSEMRLETHTVLNKAMQLYRKYGFIESVPQHMTDRCNYAMKKQLW